MAGVHLQKRDRKILEHVARYRLTTSAVLHGLFFRTLDQTKAVLKRLSAPYTPGLSEQEQRNHALRSFLQARPLRFKRQVYYQLTARGTRELGLPPERSRPLGPQALVQAYAVLIHCCRHSRTRTLFTADELAAHPLLRDVPSGLYYLEQLSDQASRLTQIVVDHRTDCQRLLERCRAILRKAEEIPTLVGMMDQQAFGLALLTLQQQKRVELEAQLAQKPFPVSVHVEVIPHLSEIIEGSRNG